MGDENTGNNADMPSIFDEEMFTCKTISEWLVDAICAIPMAERKAEAMARAAYETLRTLATEMDMNPDSEVHLRAPGEPRHFDAENSWCVVWEAGPYQWAIGASLAITMGAQKLCAPYYSFDLCFYPAEDSE